jgi:RNA ligase (TIGR02306 family)
MWIPVTDEERVQNVPEILSVGGVQWVATEKIDGTSTNVYVDPTVRGDSGEGALHGVCTRNYDLLPSDGTLWQLARRHDLHARLAGSFPDLRVALQGETYGESVQGNPLKLRGQHFAAFTLRVDGEEIPRDRWPGWVVELAVPVLDDLPFPASLDAALAAVERLSSAVSPGRPAEGVVWRARDRATVTLPDGQALRASFKVVSNRYLMKHDR